ncbi:MAG: hypothetical protein ACLUKN_03560 [Bacilli bacterium]
MPRLRFRQNSPRELLERGCLLSGNTGPGKRFLAYKDGAAVRVAYLLTPKVIKPHRDKFLTDREIICGAEETIKYTRITAMAYQFTKSKSRELRNGLSGKSARFCRRKHFHIFATEGDIESDVEERSRSRLAVVVSPYLVQEYSNRALNIVAESGLNWIGDQFQFLSSVAPLP